MEKETNSTRKGSGRWIGKVAEFKKSLFDMYKTHLEMISTMPDAIDEEFESETAEEIAAAVAAETQE